MTEEAKPQPAAPSYNNDESAAAAILQRMDPPAKEPVKEPPAEVAPEAEAEAQPEAEAESPEIQFDLDAKIFDVEEVIEGGGKEVRKYSANELKAQRMMQADYQRKTAELARQREKITDESRQAVEGERKRFLDNAQAVQKALLVTAATEFQQEGVNLFDQFALQSYMGKLSQDDPAKYIRMQNRLNEINQSMTLVTRTVEAEAKKAREERQTEVSKKSRESWDALTKDITGWTQDKYEAVLKVGYEYGFKPEEIASPVRQDGSIPDGYIPAFDSRFIKLLNDAHAYRQQQKQQPIAEKKVAAAPKVMKPGAPAKADNKQRQDEKMGRLKKTGRIDDAASILENMM